VNEEHAKKEMSSCLVEETGTLPDPSVASTAPFESLKESAKLTEPAEVEDA